ncbi:MAG: anti-sigma factor antagonist [Anaerolineales bacterium]|nr:MAG: anti-sigma factor antagonist [Anaerolineales bacterium]
MEIQVTEHKRVNVISITGRVDGSTAGEFENAMSELAQAGKNNLVLDLTEVDFISSAGLRVLVNSRKAVKSAGGNIVLVPSQQVTETLDIAGLDVLFEHFADRETAVGSF